MTEPDEQPTLWGNPGVRDLLAEVERLRAENEALLVRVLRLERNCGWDKFYSESAKREADRILASAGFGSRIGSAEPDRKAADEPDQQHD